jgi:peptidoglycan/LPS O-acetylase OafA/YrhL
MLVYVLHWHEHLAMLQPFMVAALFFAVFRADLFARLLSSLWLTVPGAMCYTIYLYHYFIIGRLLPFTLRMAPPVHPLFWDLLVQIVLLLVPVMIISAALYLLAERPFVVLSHSIADRFRKQRTTIVPAIAHPAGHEL